MAKTNLRDLPEEVRFVIAPHMRPDPDMLQAINEAVREKRDEARKARTSSGIETVWRYCEDAYVGVDSANRNEHQGDRWSKPMGPDGPVTTGRPTATTEHRSTVYVRLTARYVDAGAAKLSEILLPPDEKAFSFSETPVPALVRAKEDTSQVVHDGLGNAPLTRPAQPGELPGQPPLPPGTPAPQVPLTVKDLAQEAIDKARKAAKKAEDRIYDWMVESCYTAEFRKLVFDSARLGVGVLKAPFPVSDRVMAVSRGGTSSVKVEMRDTVRPAAAWIDPWNCFPDPACGENIQNGNYFFERDFITERELRKLKKVPGYIADQIDRIIEDGPEEVEKNSDVGPNAGSEKQLKNKFQIWYYYGALKPEEYACAAAHGGKPLDALPEESVYAIVTLINGKLIRASLNPLDSGDFPYHALPWQRRAGSWAGIGVGEQLMAPQKILNASTRTLLNNAGVSAGVQIVIDTGALKPANGEWVITPNKIWWKTGESVSADIRAMFMAVEIPNVTDQLLKIVDLAQKMAEESTSIPLVTQGQTGKTTPETLGATQLQNSNANQLLRNIGYAADDYVTEPVVRQFYEWLLLDPDVPDDEKGDFKINAHGSIALVERAIADQAIAQMGAFVKDPIYGWDPKRWADLYAKSKRLNPDDLKYSPEEQERIDSQPPPESPQVQVAKVNADTKLKVAVMKQGPEQQGAAAEQRVAEAATILEGKRIEAEERRTLADSTIRLHELQEKRYLAELEYANMHRIKIEDVRGQLAKTVILTETQKELNAADSAVNLHLAHHGGKGGKSRGMKPPAQTPGKAGNGRAFEQA